MRLFEYLFSLRTGEPRRKTPNGGSSWFRLLRPFVRWPLLAAVGFWFLATLIVLAGDEPLPYTLNMELAQPVYSRVDFDREDHLRTEEQRRHARQGVPDHFRLNASVIESIQAEMRDLHAAAKASETFEQYQKTHGGRWKLDNAAFEKLTGGWGKEKFTKKVEAVGEALVKANMIERAEVARDVRSTVSHVMLHSGDGSPRRVEKEQLCYATNSKDVAELAKDAVDEFPPSLWELFGEIVRNAISPGPNVYQPIYGYDDAFTRAQMEAMATAVEPAKSPYDKYDLLVKPGTLSAESLALLRIEHEKYLQRRATDAGLRAEWRNRNWGVAGVGFLVTVGLCLFTVKTQRRIIEKAPRAFALAGLLLLMLALDRLVLLPLGHSSIWAVSTVAMTAAILTIAYSQLFALGTTAGLTILTVIVMGGPFSLALVFLAVAYSTVLMLREIRTRMKMVVVGLVTAVVAGFTTMLVSLSDGQGWTFSIALYGALAAMAGLSLVWVLLPVIEKAFGISTSLTLLEWADTSKPLLRQLIEKAPGTWQHSHLLGSMAEAAAEDIGANGLLVRVGAYYHDIGKLFKPQYFVENQEATVSAHQGLAPTMSLLVILAHVKDGLALAREHRLPPGLHQFITEHHGTTVVKYFHARASQEAKASRLKSREVSESEFRYPGPRPRSKESAILMLCDSVEGAVRALQDPTPGRIESKVHEIVIGRLMDGQFDDCDITLKELARIEQSLVKSLRAIHHGRIAYPKSEESTESKVRSASA